MTEEKTPEQHHIEEVKGWLDLKLTSGRVSTLLVNELAYGMVNRTVHVHKIYDEIGGLEGAESTRPTNTKPASDFKHPPLQGLWHKHYTDASHILTNIGNHWGINPKKDASDPNNGKKFAKFINDEILAGQQTVELTPQVLGKIASHFVLAAHEQRNEAQKMTGEWIVYAIHNDENYYLTLATHKEGDEVIAARVRECAAEFPELNLHNYI